MELSTLTSEQYRHLEAVDLMRMLSSKACAEGGSPAEYYQQRWGRTSPLASTVLKAFEWEAKAAVAPATTTGATWAAPLVTSRMGTGFLALVRQASVIGKLPVSLVPFNVKLPYQVSGASMKWVSEGTPKPATKLGLGSLTLLPVKASGIIVVSAELMRLSAPGSEQALQQILSNELTTFVDAAFLGTAAAAAGSPAGLLNGVAASASIAATISALFTARPNASPTWVAAPAILGTLSGLDPANVPSRFKGYPLVTSPGAGANLVLVDAAAVAVADGGLELDVTREALIEMNDAAATATAATVYSSLWQDNLAGIRVERFVNWQAATGAVQYTATLS